MTNTIHSDLFSSLISDIKNYSGKDPLIPWLRGIKKMKECLPPLILKEKLPRFLQKCAQNFETDRRYKNDMRYLRVWLELMDYIDEPKALLRTMETNRIGTKRSLFYQAYALYYEKIKKFEEADKMYHFGVQNLAEPLDELQKSYEKFLLRLKLHKNKRLQRQEEGDTGRALLVRNASQYDVNKENNKNIRGVDDHCKGTLYYDSSVEALKTENGKNRKALEERSQNVIPRRESDFKREVSRNVGSRGPPSQKRSMKREADELCGDNTLVVKFVDTAIVGTSEAEDACHHGLVEPTINMKEAMNAINNMFREPLEPKAVGRRFERNRPKIENNLNNAFEVFVDDNHTNNVGLSHQNRRKKVEEPRSLPQLPFKIYVDEVERIPQKQQTSEKNRDRNPNEGAYVFPSPNNSSPKHSDDLGIDSSSHTKVGEDTVICRFVGSAITNEPEVENVCHHGLVDPTVNLKEAMEDINNMFGKPIEFVRAKRPKRHENAADRKSDCGGFSILPDEGLEQPKGLPPKPRECDLFEPTICTKEAMDEINKMFGAPLDF